MFFAGIIGRGISHEESRNVRRTALAVALFAIVVSLFPDIAIGATKMSAYNRHGISFHYPSSWQIVPSSEAKPAGKELVSDAKGIITLAAIGGVDSLSSDGSRGCVAILAKMKFTSAYRKELKGNEKKFIARFEAGIRGTAKTKIVSSGTGSFAGRSKAAELQAQTKTDGSTIHDQFFVAIAKNDKSVDLAIFVVAPAKLWSKFSKQLSALAASSRFS